MDARRAVVLQALGIERFIPRAVSQPRVAVVPSEVAAMDRQALSDTIGQCQQCALGASRTRPVVGSGAEAAPWFLLAETPDAEDDRSGVVLSGRAGALLTSMLRALGLAREQVFVSTAVKCVPSVRAVTVSELAACAPYVHRQVVLQQPKVVLCLGARVADQLLGVAGTLGDRRGRVHRLESAGCAVVVTHSLAEILKVPARKAQVWADLQLAADVVHGRIS